MKTILLDCDGVLADFSLGVCEVVKTITGRDFKPDNITEWDFCKALKLAPDEARDVRRALSMSGHVWPNLKPFPAAQEAVKCLYKVANVYVITSPWNSCKTWLHEREAWLDLHFDIPHTRVIATSAKHLVSGDIFVDDKPGNVEAWHHAQGWTDDHGGESRAVLWDAPYNREAEIDGAIRATSWAQIEELV